MNKVLLFLTIILCTSIVQAQVVDIPDPNFKAALFAWFPTIDTNNDKEIQKSEAQLVTVLNVNSNAISSLKGIEAFTSLTHLYCDDNLLTSLDMSKNVALTHLYCSSNKLEVLDVSKNALLVLLYSQYNKLQELNVSNNTVLVSLHCGSNKLLELDVSNNKLLEYFVCSANQLSHISVGDNISLTDFYCHLNNLTELDVSKNTNLNLLKCIGNPELLQICINSDQKSKTELMPSNWEKSDFAEWSTTCHTITSLEEYTYDSVNKILLRIITPQGQDIKPEQAMRGMYIYQYSDGSTRKMMKTE